MVQDEAGALCRQLAIRGRLTLSEVTAIVMNFNSAANVALVLGHLGDKIVTQYDSVGLPTYVLLVEARVRQQLNAPGALPVQLSSFSRDARLFIRTHAGRLNVAVNGSVVQHAETCTSVHVLSYIAARDPMGVNLTRYIRHRPTTWPVVRELVASGAVFVINGYAWVSNHTVDTNFRRRWIEAGSAGNRVRCSVDHKRHKLSQRRVRWRLATDSLC